MSTDQIPDATGRPVRVGDTVGGTTSGRYQATIVGPVMKIGKGQVKVRVRQSGHTYSAAVGDDKWISTSRLFLVEAASPVPLIVYYDHAVMEPRTDEGETDTIVGCRTKDGRPVALVLSPGSRAGLGRALTVAPADLCQFHGPAGVPCGCGHDDAADCHPNPRSTA